MGFSSFYIGATGMKTHSTNMQVLGNNIANVNTVGFKASRAHFENLFYSEVASANSETGIAQAGHGVSLSAILTDYSQGAAQTTNTTTDVSVGGLGFFKVVRDDATYYTRAGNFRFDNEGVLRDPNGYAVQGQNGDIALEPDANGLVIMDSVATTEVTYAANIPPGDYASSPDITSPLSAGANPFFNMMSLWTPTDRDTTGFSSAVYSWAEGFTIYDDQGQGHDLMFYFDQVDSDTIHNAGSSRHFEYMVAIDPNEDGSVLAGTSGAGILVTGTLRFTSSGNLVEQTAFSYDGTGDVGNLSNWTPTDLNLTSTFASGGTANFTLDFGLGQTAGSGVSNAAAVGNNAARLQGTQGIAQTPALTAYEASGGAYAMSQNGYPEGVLVDIQIDREGNLIGQFTNSQDRVLDRFILTSFTNQYGLRREGNNYFSYTPEAGAATDGNPTEDHLGTIVAKSLEQSNVELARELVSMISTQRGFQSNSKVITTSDQLLQTAINLKR